MEKRMEKVCDLLDEIYAIGHIMQLVFENMENSQIRVNPQAVARCGKMIAANIVEITEVLHDHPP